MEWFPELGFGWLNGWIYFAFYIIVFGIFLSTCSSDVIKRLYDRSLWDKRTRIIAVIGKISSFINIISILFGKIKIGTIEFVIGTILYLLGLAILVIGLINYKNAPLDKPIINGLYKVSRNPQIASIFILFTGMVLIISSWFNLILVGVAFICTHFTILGEEYSLTQQYGDSYLEYKKQVARYFLIV